ncbi:hypothetical protein G3I44_04155 [Halogeometricum borinquense]|uniref:Uncharacterized protein n=1 Tax=Halogeometricum borinquense TaxID=60847 RepID=A0A6C0UDT5_9EURY|nr:hypothetical protein [Halogeometricum borinquense]QIB73546.1 hypothetical protein G3I44_04155 [Halogeometricum borinquense]
MGLSEYTWLVIGTAALFAGALAAKISPSLFIAGVLVVMVPVWGYRSRGSRTPERMIKQMAYEMQDSLQTALGVGTALMLVMALFVETMFAGAGDMLGALAGPIAANSLPLAYIGTTLAGIAGISGTAELGAKTFAGFALMLAAGAIILRRS